MNIEIKYATPSLSPSFHEALGQVAREQVYIEMIDPPSLEKCTKFQLSLIKKNEPVYYALDGQRVVGWCDASASSNPRLSHRAGLGMGCLPEYRGKGIGTKLLSAVLEHAKLCGLEKIELHVYTSNKAAISLYEKFGFETEGLIKKYRKLDGKYFDCLAMAKFL